MNWFHYSVRTKRKDFGESSLKFDSTRAPEIHLEIKIVCSISRALNDSDPRLLELIQLQLLTHHRNSS